jgi:hypothetical protein
MENTIDLNIFNKNEIIEEENNNGKSTTTVLTAISVEKKIPMQENVREKRIRKQKQYDDDYVLFNTNTKHNHKNQQHNLIQDDFIKIENLDYENNLLVVNSNLDSASTSMISPTNEIKFNVGNLVWAKVSGHPWWPCRIAMDYSENTHVKLVGATRPKKMFYVKFFGPSVEHAWVTEGCLIEYKGIEAFKTYAQDQVDQAPNKSQKEKLAERFQLKVALTRRDHWERAVEEADDAINKRSETKTIPHKSSKNNGKSNELIYNEENEENLTSRKITKTKRDSTWSVVANEDVNIKNKTKNVFPGSNINNHKRKVTLETK